MELTVLSTTGKATGRKVTLPDAVFGITPNNHVIYLAVKQYLANQRQGTHKSKQRNEVAGSTRKLFKQKGTGGARHGSIKAPIYVGGGRIFGPQPRDYSFKINSKVKSLARYSALSYKAIDSAISVVENFTFDKPKTKQYLEILKSLSLDNKKTLVVLGSLDNNVYLSSRNLGNTKVVPFEQLNTYDILHADTLVLMEGAVEKFANL